MLSENNSDYVELKIPNQKNIQKKYKLAAAPSEMCLPSVTLLPCLV